MFIKLFVIQISYVKKIKQMIDKYVPPTADEFGSVKGPTVCSFLYINNITERLSSSVLTVTDNQDKQRTRQTNKHTHMNVDLALMSLLRQLSCPFHIFN